MSEHTYDFLFVTAGGTIRSCLDCGLPVSGGPTRCVPCATEAPNPQATMEHFITDVTSTLRSRNTFLHAAMDRIERAVGVPTQAASATVEAVEEMAASLTTATARAERAEAERDEARAGGDALVDLIARESHAVGISETMTPEQRVRAMRAAVERLTAERDEARRSYDGCVSDLRSMEKELEKVCAELDEARGLLREVREVLALCTTRTFDALPEDPIARELGERLGYGALMSAASKEWAASNARHGMPPGSQHTCGPCEATVQKALESIDNHLRGGGK